MTEQITARLSYMDVDCVFHVDNPNDIIQRTLLAGSFYEIEELEYLKSIIPPHSNVLDIGANIGNHTVFFSKICRCDSVIPFEANPPAIALLTETAKSNDLVNVDLSYLGKAVGKTEGYVEFSNVQNNNLGSQEFKPTLEQAGIPCRPIDAFNFKNIDFIKVDVEGMEIDVLEGMERTINLNKSVLYVESKKRNLPLLFALLRKHNYRIEKTFQRYKGVFNFLCFPVY